jgi:hypothetical protein
VLSNLGRLNAVPGGVREVLTTRKPSLNFQLRSPAKYPQGESNPRYGRERPAC